METASARFAIGTLSKGTGCNVETIRYYERSGLLSEPARSPGGYRLYGTEHLKRLTFIRRARALGFSIDEVRTLLDLADHHRRPCAEARVVAAAHLGDVRAKIADLQVMERVLKRAVARCGEGTGAHCPLIEALYREERGAASPVASNAAGTPGRRPRTPAAAAPVRARARRQLRRRLAQLAGHDRAGTAG